MKNLSVIAVSLIMSGCAFAPSGGVKLNPGAENVEIGSQKPTSYYVSNGSLVGQDGGGCGYYGYFGTRANAINDLLNKAASIGADYVQIIGEQDSYKSMSCETNLYKISAVAYRADEGLRKKLIEEQAVHEMQVLKREQEQARRQMAEFVDGCKAMGFKTETDGMAMCVLTQQARYDAALNRQQQSQLAQEALEAQSQAEYRRQLADQESLRAQRSAQEEAAMQGLLQNMQKSLTPSNKIINCNTLGSNTRCTEY